jgi:hypothetical protein
MVLRFDDAANSNLDKTNGLNNGFSICPQGYQVAIMKLLLKWKIKKKNN